MLSLVAAFVLSQSCSVAIADFPKVLALGDSITFGAKPDHTQLAQPWPWQLRLTNAGIGGETSAQLLSRWTNAYRGHGYTTLVLLGGGNNDQSTGIAEATTLSNLETIVTQAIADGLTVYWGTVLPCKNDSYFAIDTAAISALNADIRTRAAADGATLLDYYATMGGADPTALLAAYDSGDGLHPNQAGASHMADVVGAALGITPYRP